MGPFDADYILYALLNSLLVSYKTDVESGEDEVGVRVRGVCVCVCLVYFISPLLFCSFLSLTLLLPSLSSSSSSLLPSDPNPIYPCPFY
jgi:UPF0716 family protein affecting phage T7 exclusion